MSTIEIPPHSPRPAHVPLALVRDFDLFNAAGGREDVHGAWKKFQTDYPPIFWTPRNGGLWMITRAKDIIELQKDYEHFSMKGALVPNHPRPFPAPPMDIEPPEHGPWRLLISPAFSPKVVAEVEEMVRKVTIDAIESFKKRGECEFVSEFTRILPIYVFLTMMGLPFDDAKDLLPLADKIATSPRPDQLTEARLALKAYIQRQVDARKVDPKPDLITHIMNSEIDGKKIPEEYAVGMCTLALSGGLDTVKNMLGFIAIFLAKHPDHVRQLRENPALIPHATEELFRRHGVSVTARLVRKDVEFMGVQLKAGDQIQGPGPLVGLDDETVPDPMTVDFNRPAPIPHATFGHGPHRCPGSILAKREVTVFLEEWLKRIPEFHIKEGTVPQQNIGMVNNVSELWLAWDTSKVS